MTWRRGKRSACKVHHPRLNKRLHELKLLGRVNSLRSAGMKLLFIDLQQRGNAVQIVCNYAKMYGQPNEGAFHEFCRTIQKGDVCSKSSTGIYLAAHSLPTQVSMAYHTVRVEASSLYKSRSFHNSCHHVCIPFQIPSQIPKQRSATDTSIFGPASD